MPIELVANLDSRNLARLNRLAGVSRLHAAKALTFSAQKARPMWIAGHRVFHRRNTWIDRGVRFSAATPGNLNAKVGSVDQYMSRHVVGLGEDKAGEKGRLMVPIYDDISDVQKHDQFRAKYGKDFVPKYGKYKGQTRQGRALSTKRKPFLIQAGGNTYLVRRKGKKRAPLVFLGVLEHMTRTDPTLDAVGIVARATNAAFPQKYEEQLLNWWGGQK